jgi:hypothetical protein
MFCSSLLLEQGRFRYVYIYILNVSNLSWLMGGRGGYSLGGSTLA